MSKEQALKCCGLAVQSSSSSVEVPSASKTLLTTTKRPAAKTDAPSAARGSGPAATLSAQIPESSQSTWLMIANKC